MVAPAEVARGPDVALVEEHVAYYFVGEAGGLAIVDVSWSAATLFLAPATKPTGRVGARWRADDVCPSSRPTRRSREHHATSRASSPVLIRRDEVVSFASCNLFRLFR